MAKSRAVWRRVGVPAAVAAGLALVAIPAGRRAFGVGEKAGAGVLEALPVAVEVAPFGPETVADEVPFSGTLKERRKVELSFQVPGTVGSLHQVKGPDGVDRDVQAGDRVARGVVLARLDESDFLRDRETAREDLARAVARSEIARANADLARRDLDRDVRLSARGASTSEALDSSRNKLRVTASEVVVAGHEVASARLALKKAEDDLADCSLAVPLDEATVVRRSVARDERVAANAAVFLLIDASKLVVTLGVPDSLVGRIASGQAMAATSDAFPGESFAGRVTKIAPMADPETRTFPVEVTVDAPRGLRPGMVVSVDLGRSAEARLVPIAAILRGDRPGDFVAFEVSREGDRPVARRRRVEVDGVADNRARIKPGPGTELRDGAEVVVAGAHRLTEGQAVRVLGSGDSKGATR